MPRLLRTIAIATLVPSFATALSAQSEFGGDWRIDRTRGDTVQLNLTYESKGGGTGNTGRTIALSELRGLTRAQVEGSGPVRFQIVRDAGTFTFDGQTRNGRGLGDCTFAPRATFAAQLARPGIDRPTPRQQCSMAMHHVSRRFIDALDRLGYEKPTVASLDRAGMHGAALAYLSSLDGLGYRVGTLESLITLRDHGVDGEFISGMREAGYRDLRSEERRVGKEGRSAWVR